MTVKALPDKVDYSQFPDATGHFGRYGGRFVAETLMEALHELNEAWQNYRNDPEFLAELDVYKRQGLLGSVVSGSGPADGIGRRGTAAVSDRHRLESARR